MTERSIVAAALFASEDRIVNMFRDSGDDALIEAAYLVPAAAAAGSVSWQSDVAARP